MKALRCVMLSLFLALFLLADASPRSSARQRSGQEQSADKLPPDIHPDTLSRMPRAQRDEFTSDEDKRMFDQVLTNQPKQRVSRWLGPTGTRLHLPALAVAYNAQDRLLMRDTNSLEPRYVELTISVATRQTDNREEWLNHEPDALKLLGPEVLGIIRKNGDTASLSQKDAAVIQFGRELFHQPKVSSKTFAALESNFGRNGALNITLIMCYYASNGMLMRAYDQHMDTSPDCVTPHTGCLNEKDPIPSW